MTIKLIYHTPESTSSDVSPFDRAILQVSTGQEVWITCPYLNLAYLKRIIGCSNKSWRLITDIEEWLAIHNHASKLTIQEFIVQNQDRIHHIRDLHAKIIIAGEMALVGSANFTDKGVTTRLEMSVLFEQAPQVEELRNWFATLWMQSSPINTDELQTYIADMQPRSSVESKPERRLTSKVAPVHSKLQPLTSHNRSKLSIPYNEATSKHLIERVKFAPTREWIDTYFDLMKLLIDATGLKNDDPRLVTSIPTSAYFLPVSVNNRYVLAPRKKKDDFLVAIIYGPEFEAFSELRTKVVYYGRFDPLFRSEGLNDTPFFIRFQDANIILDSKEIQEAWIDATLLEMQRATGSPYRRFHQPLVYEAAVNLDYREMILEKAFSIA